MTHCPNCKKDCTPHTGLYCRECAEAWMAGDESFNALTRYWRRWWPVEIIVVKSGTNHVETKILPPDI